MPLHVQRQVVGTGETPEEREETTCYTLALRLLLDLQASQSADIPGVKPPVGGHLSCVAVQNIKHTLRSGGL